VTQASQGGKISCLKTGDGKLNPDISLARSFPLRVVSTFLEKRFKVGVELQPFVSVASQRRPMGPLAAWHASLLRVFGRNSPIFYFGRQRRCRDNLNLDAMKAYFFFSCFSDIVATHLTVLGLLYTMYQKCCRLI
jgi:hypothetical protein